MLKSLIVLFVHLNSLCCPVLFQARPFDSLNRTSLFIYLLCLYIYNHTVLKYVWMTILESGWNLWVWLVGVVSRRWVWLVVRRYIDILTIIINFPYSTCISSFWQQHPYFFVHF